MTQKQIRRSYSNETEKDSERGEGDLGKWSWITDWEKGMIEGRGESNSCLEKVTTIVGELNLEWTM